MEDEVYFVSFWCGNGKSLNVYNHLYDGVGTADVDLTFFAIGMRGRLSFFHNPVKFGGNILLPFAFLTTNLVAWRSLILWPPKSYPSKYQCLAYSRIAPPRRRFVLRRSLLPWRTPLSITIHFFSGQLQSPSHHLSSEKRFSWIQVSWTLLRPSGAYWPLPWSSMSIMRPMTLSKTHNGSFLPLLVLVMGRSKGLVTSMVTKAKLGKQEFKCFLNLHQATTIKGSLCATSAHPPSTNTLILCQLLEIIVRQNKITEKHIELKWEKLDLCISMEAGSKPLSFTRW